MGICNEYVAVYDGKESAPDVDCFVPLMENSTGNTADIKIKRYPIFLLRDQKKYRVSIWYT